MKKIISVLSSSVLLITANAQINIGSNQPPDSSAMLQISGTTKGFLPPRMSHDSMMLISNPAKGLMVFNTTDSTLYMHRDSGWMPLSGGSNGLWLQNSNGLFNSDSTSNVGIGTSTPMARLHVLDSSVLFSAGGDVSWSYDETSAISGAGRRMMWLPSKAAFRAGGVYGNLWDIDSTGYYSFAAGVDAEAKGDMSVALGYGPIATGYGAIALGIYSNSNGEGSLSAGYGTASGDFSVAINAGTTASGSSSFAVNNNTQAIGDGSSAFGYNTTANGQFSAAFGEQSNPSGEASFAAGFATAASGQYSFASGYVSGASGLGSTAMGFFNSSSATYTVTLGGHCTANADYSIAIGESATASGLYANVMGWNATASGYGSLSLGQSTVSVGTFSTAIGTSDSAKGDYSIAMGNGTSAPSGFEAAVGTNNTTYVPLSTTGWNPADRLFTIGNGTSSSATSDAMVVLKNGNIGIGNSSPTNKLDVNGNIAATGTVTGLSFLNLSDARFKKDIHPLQYSLDAVMKLQGVSWHWKTAEFTNKGFTNAKQIGFIAQDVEKVVPEVVLTDAKGYKGIDYAKLTAVLTEAVKAQQEEIMALKKEVAANTMQQQTIDALTKRLSQLEASIAQKSSAVEKTESR